MMKKMTKKEGRAYLKRWKEVRRALVQEWQQTSLTERFKEFLLLLDTWPFFSSHVKAVKERAYPNHWARLRKQMQHG